MNTSFIKKGGKRISSNTFRKYNAAGIAGGKLSEKSKLRVTGGHKADGSFIKDGRVAREQF